MLIRASALIRAGVIDRALVVGADTGTGAIGTELAAGSGLRAAEHYLAEAQLAQVEDAVASGNYDGFVILANDTVGIASAISDAFASGKCDLGSFRPRNARYYFASVRDIGIVASILYYRCPRPRMRLR